MLERMRPKLEKNDTPLMQRLLEAGYPREDMEHYGSDLYIYVTPETTKVIEQWCKEHGYDRACHCPTFFEKTSGRWMYDCAFQYLQYTGYCYPDEEPECCADCDACPLDIRKDCPSEGDYPGEDEEE